jgi:hypothetical protein
MSRRLEQRVVHPNGITEEWGPADRETVEVYERHIRNFGDREGLVRQFVRAWNETAKRHGDWTRIRSVEEDES